MDNNASNYYDESYALYQIPIGEFGGWANLTKFQKYIREGFNVLDFGCGGGFLLKNIKCKGKIGVEVNESARRQAKAINIKVVASIDEVEDNWADLVISNHSLEHTLHPLKALQQLYMKLKKGGQIVFVVPCESVSHRYRPNNVDRHLYSWSPMSLGNLFREAGFHIEESKSYIHKWPPFYRAIAKFGGRFVFEIACRIYGQIERSWFQVIVVAKK